ncbi:MAG: hypothetical protein IH594_16660, partial [Bacteroidales bacterium]|nr:hypothetical protein [Bacteroidales bacterium]
TYGGPGEEKVYNITSSGSGSYFITGHTTSFGAGNYDILFLEIDDNGNLLNAKTYGGSGADREGYHTTTSDGGLIISGYTNSFGAGMSDTYLIKADQDGNSCCSNDIEGMQVMNANPSLSAISFSISNNIGYTNYFISESLVETNEMLVCMDSIRLIGPDSVCQFAEQIMYNLEPSISITLEWVVPDGAEISEFIGDTAVIINFGNSSGYIKIINPNCGEIILDSLYVTVFQTAIPNLGNDTIICSNSGFWLNPEGSFEEYLWQNGSTDSVFFIESTGLYWVQAWDGNGCSSLDSIYIEFYPSPEINLGNDTLICLNDSLILNVEPGYNSYLWNTGSTGQQIVVYSSGVYWIEVTNEFGCMSRDSIMVQIYPMAFEELNLGPDTSFCENSLLTLNAGSGYTYYQWMNQPGGMNDSLFVVDTAGTYYVYVSNPCSQGWDTIQVEMLEVQEIELGNDTTLCNGDLILLDAGFGFVSYLWQDGLTNSTYYAGASGWYWVEVTDENACIAADSIHLDFVSPDPDIGPDTSFCEGDSVFF